MNKIQTLRLLEADTIIPPENFIVVRIDGRHFHTLTKKQGYEKPFDTTFRDEMVTTVDHLMSFSGFNIVYGYTQSDEISLLINKEDDTFSRRRSKILSVLAGEASSSFSRQIGVNAAFDARISAIPNFELVQDYFLWRYIDAERNAINATAFYGLVAAGMSETVAAKRLHGMNTDRVLKEVLMPELHIDWSDIPVWCKHGIGMYFHKIAKTGYNPKTNENVTAIRNVLDVNYNLPMRNAYAAFLTYVYDNSRP